MSTFSTKELRKVHQDGMINLRELARRIDIDKNTLYAYLYRDLDFGKKYSEKTKEVLRDHIAFCQKLVERD